MWYKGIRLTKHALQKIDILRKYGFEISLDTIVDVIENPARVDKRGKQYLAIKPIDEEHALRVVYEVREGIKVVITIYPVRRDRYGV